MRPPSLINQTPLAIILILPIISAIFAFISIRLKSAIQFQQGTLSAVPWRIALCMSLLSIPPYMIWCMIIPGPSSLFFLAGNLLAVLVCHMAISPILHYIPSPIITCYLQNRYHSQILRLSISLLQCLFCSLSAILFLSNSNSLIFSVSSFSYPLVSSLTVGFAIISILFAGHSILMTPVLILYSMVIVSGFGVLLYFSIEHVHSIEAIVPLTLSAPHSIYSFAIGFILSLFLLTSSHSYYQVYFPLSTIHKLRLSLIFYSVFQVFAYIFVFLMVSLFGNFMAAHCSIQPSYLAFFQFIQSRVSHPFLSCVVVSALLSLFSFCFQWNLLSLSTLFYEEFIKIKMRTESCRKQLITLQFFIILAGGFLCLASVLLNMLPKVSYNLAAVMFILSGCSIITGIFLCGYFLPFANSKGALFSLFISFIFAAGLSYLYVINNNLPIMAVACDKEATNTTVLVVSTFNMEKMYHFAIHMPLYTHPIIMLILCILVLLLISFFTGGVDQMSLDWNLVVFACAPLMNGRHSKQKRHLVDSQSFRYAAEQNTFTQ